MKTFVVVLIGCAPLSRIITIFVSIRCQKNSVMSGQVFLGLTSTKQGTQSSAFGEARTRNPSISSQAHHSPQDNNDIMLY